MIVCHSVEEFINKYRDPNRSFRDLTFEDEEMFKDLYLYLLENQNDRHQINALGNCYLYGKGTQKDEKKAFEIFLNAAENGDTIAQFNVGNCYFYGNGTKQDYSKAVKWYTSSANNANDSFAENSLANCYYYGYGVEKNDAEAVKWYAKAASQGHARAQNNLAYCYSKGIGVNVNEEKAAKLYQQALENGLETCRDELNKILYSIEEEKSKKILHLSKRKDVFISWNHLDKDLKDGLCKRLEANNILTVWESDGDGSGELDPCIENAIKTSRSFIILLTGNSLKSEWVKKEIKLILDKIKKNEVYKKCLRPVIVNTIIEDGKAVFFDVSQKLASLENDNPFKELMSYCSIFTTLDNNIDYSLLFKSLQNAIEVSLLYEYRSNAIKKFTTFPIALTNVVESKSNHSGIANITLNFEEGYLSRPVYYQNNPVSVETLLDKKEPILIYGESGTGKSLYLKNILRKHFECNRYIFYLATKDIINDKYDNLPFLEILKINGFDHFFPTEQTQRVSLISFESIFTSHNDIIILVDALDEIPSNKRLELFKKIDEFSDKYPDVHFIFTSRNKSDSKLIDSYFSLDCLVYQLKGLEKEDVEVLFDKLSNKCYSDTPEDNHSQINESKDYFFISLEQITDDIKRNPLLISNLIFIYFTTNQIPNKKYDIINKSVNIMIKDVEYERDIRFQYLDYIKGNKLNILLGELAFQRANHNEQTVEEIIEEHLRKTYSQDLEYDLIASEITEYLRQRSIIVNENISHEIFKDYFTSLYLFNSVYQINIGKLLRKSYGFKEDGEETLNILMEECFNQNETPWPTVACYFLLKLDFEIHLLNTRLEMNTNHPSYEVFSKTLSLALKENNFSPLAYNTMKELIEYNSLYFKDFFAEYLKN